MGARSPHCSAAQRAHNTATMQRSGIGRILAPLLQRAAHWGGAGGAGAARTSAVGGGGIAGWDARAGGAWGAGAPASRSFSSGRGLRDTEGQDRVASCSIFPRAPTHSPRGFDTRLRKSDCTSVSSDRSSSALLFRGV